ncbi:MAG: bifunctional riboflavin kinase/FAD synthetase [Planctomycetota bacterium]|nr:MAG: bifunctional riboflavin kinase/FAD synthetase [Planctomycetota bacterium]
MKIFYELDAITPGQFIRPVLTLGIFDGFHRGHQALIHKLNEWAAKVEGESVVITFDRIPERVLQNKEPFQITSLPHRLLLFENYGINAAIVVEFNENFAQINAGDFIRLLAERISPHGILMGFDSAFGKGRQGTAAFARKHGEYYGIKVHEVPPLEVSGETVSSTRIRERIIAGDLEAATEMLGRPVSIYGLVIKGDSRGRKLGYPTANIDPEHYVRLPNGVYGGEVQVNRKTYPTLINVGRRPTFETNGRELIEAHLVGFSGNLYSEELLVRFFKKLRDEKAFSSAEELVRQIDADKEAFLKVYHSLRTSIS